MNPNGRNTRCTPPTGQSTLWIAVCQALTLVWKLTCRQKWFRKSAYTRTLCCHMVSTMPIRLPHKVDWCSNAASVPSTSRRTSTNSPFALTAGYGQWQRRQHLGERDWCLGTDLRSALPRQMVASECPVFGSDRATRLGKRWNPSGLSGCPTSFALQ